MCGILGATEGHARSLANATAISAMRGLSHRGPDDEGIVVAAGGCVRAYSLDETLPQLGYPPLPADGLVAGDLVLGHRRLSIIDLSAGGHQPMASPSGRYWIAFNGEIYNYRELRDQLRDLGHDFRTESDTEVLLAAFDAWGIQAFARCEGMFAIALYDRDSGSLLLTRDRFGIKPLYYFQAADGLVFASEIRTIRALLPKMTFELDHDVAHGYLAAGISDSSRHTFIRGIEQVMPGELMTVTRDGIVRASWVPPRAPFVLRGSYAERKQAVRDALFRSVELHLRADVPVGVCLSGGVDSSLLLAIVREVLGAQHHILSFSYVADGSSESEEPFIDMVCKRFGTDARKCRVDFRQLLGVSGELPALLASMDEPVISTSVVAQQSVYGLAHSAGIRVVLDGQGSDELFAGYADYASVRLAELLRAAKLPEASGLARALGRGREGRRVAVGMLLALPSFVQRAVIGATVSRSRGGWLTGNGTGTEFATRALIETHRPDLQRALSASRSVAPLPALLRFADRNSMLASVESRVPFLSTVLSDVVTGLCASDLISGTGVRKAILRDIARDLIPAEVIDRPKVGFTAPRSLWAGPLGEWDDRLLEFSKDEGAAWVDSRGVERLLRNARQGSVRAQDAAWRLLNFALWIRATGVRAVAR
ncbi:MAG: asparagine synthase (glutamine-hydrolyzing) [bacterium]